MEKKIYDSDLMEKHYAQVDESYKNEKGEIAYYNGAYYNFDGLDVQNLKNPIFEKLN